MIINLNLARALTDFPTIGLIYFSNLNFDVAIKPSPTIPIVILAGNGRVLKNIKIVLTNAKKIPTTN